MAKKTRSFIALILVVVMALSLCGISAMAVDEGNQGPTAKTMTYDGNPFTVYITCNGEPLTEEVSLSLEYDHLLFGWGSTDHTATTSTGSNTFYVIGTRQYRAVASWNGMTVTSGPVYVDLIVGDSVTINFDLTYT
ncbi:MAG: hypothetical protein EOM14_12860, partial [Clostridia bacterium]|nr:hypothetical protein [Clostridia bacterium]